MMQDYHNEHTKRLWMRPDVIGLEDIIMSTNEVNMFKDNGDLYHQPDNIFFDYNHYKIYNCEYKGGSCQKTKAIKQLKETAQYLRMMFRNYDIVNLYIHDDYKFEEIK